MPSFCKKLSENSFRLYPRDFPKNVQISKGALDFKKNISKPVLCAVEIAPIIEKVKLFKTQKSSFEILFQKFTYITIIVMVLSLILCILSKNILQYCSLILLIGSFTESILFQFILRYIAVSSINKYDIETKDENSYEEDSNSSFWKSDTLIEEFSIPRDSSMIINISSIAPEIIGNINSIAFSSYSPIFNIPFILTQNIIVFDSKIESIDTSFSFTISPPLEAIDKYMANVAPIYFCAYPSFNLTVFEPIFIKKEEMYYPQISKALSFYPIKQNIENLRNIYIFDSNQNIAQANLVSDETDISAVCKGDFEIVSKMCTKIWNGNEVTDLSAELIEHINDIISHSDGKSVAFAQSMYSCDSIPTEDSIITPNEIPNFLLDMTLLGIIVFEHRVIPESEHFLDELNERLTRFSIFISSQDIPRNILKNISKMGIPTDFNCMINLNNSTPNLYSEMGIANTNMPVGLDQLANYISTYDKIPLTVPLYVDGTDNEKQKILEMRSENGQKICVIRETYGENYGYTDISIDSFSESLSLSTIQCMMAVNDVISIQSMCHFSASASLDHVGSFLEECRSLLYKMKLSVGAFFVSQMIIVFLAGISDIMVGGYSKYIIIAFAVLFAPVFSIFIMYTGNNNTLTKKHFDVSVYSPSFIVLIVAKFIIVVLSVFLSNYFGSKSWNNLLIITTFGFFETMKTFLHPLRYTQSNNRFYIFGIILLASVCSVSIYIERANNWGVFVLSLVSTAICELIELGTKTISTHNYNSKYALAHLDFTTRLGAFSPD